MNRLYFSAILFSTLLSLAGQAQGKVNSLSGQQLYQKYCLTCHQSDGGGVPRMTPPLFGTDYTTGDKKRLISIVLNGLNEPIEVQDENYFSPMASFSYLTDKEIASILTYVRTHFGNKAGPVTDKEVTAVRKTLVKK
ncbi:MAG: c-type cytochrome [Chitinophagaceae bacterium]